jgi:peptidoglycan/xylan/chitin deacetylase (PgdA/CDA1 family)
MRRQVTKVVAAVAVALAIVFWLVSGGRTHTTKLSINGRPVWVDGSRPTLANALATGRVQPRDGALLSVVTKKVIDPHAAPAQLLVDGATVPVGQRLNAGEKIVVRNGADATEPLVRRRLDGIITGLPPVEDRIWVGDRSGTEEVEVGERSGEVVSRATVAPGGAAHPATANVVALTFDDGPNPQWTPAVLQVLKEENIKATFCTVGYLAQRYPQLVKAEFDAGHTMCDHSMHHILRLDQRPHPQIIDEVVQAADAIRAITGQEPPFYRPPGGSLNQDIIDTAHNRGLRVLKWSVDPHDYEKPPAPAILARITAKVGPGSVVLLHDGGGDRSQTVAMLKQLIDELKARGFTFYAWQ